MLHKGMLSLLVAVMAGFAGGLLAGHLPSAQAKAPLDMQADSVSARLFRLINSKGDVLAVLGAEKDSLPMLVLRDAQGKDRAALRMAETGPELLLSDKDENLRVKLQVAEDGLPALFFLDQKDKNRFSAILAKSGNPALLLLAPEGQGALMLDINETGRPRVVLGGAGGKPQAAMTTHEAFGPGVFLMNQAGDISMIYGAQGVLDPGKAPSPAPRR